VGRGPSSGKSMAPHPGPLPDTGRGRIFLWHRLPRAVRRHKYPPSAEPWLVWRRPSRRAGQGTECAGRCACLPPRWGLGPVLDRSSRGSAFKAFTPGYFRPPLWGCKALARRRREVGTPTRSIIAWLMAKRAVTFQNGALGHRVATSRGGGVGSGMWEVVVRHGEALRAAGKAGGGDRGASPSP
jgi:hypothetical protein